MPKSPMRAKMRMRYLTILGRKSDEAACVTTLIRIGNENDRKREREASTRRPHPLSFFDFRITRRNRPKRTATDRPSEFLEHLLVEPDDLTIIVPMSDLTALPGSLASRRTEHTAAMAPTIFVDGLSDGRRSKGPPKMYHKKSKTGCQRCRTRRVKVSRFSCIHCVEAQFPPCHNLVALRKCRE